MLTDIQTILIVDDDPVQRLLLKRALESADYHTIQAEDGIQALEMITKVGMPHLALIDLQMPRMGGVELCQKISKLSDTPIIILTSTDDDDTVASMLQNYAEDFIVKPASPPVLLARVQRVLRRMDSFAYTMEPATQIDQHLTLVLPQRMVLIDGKEVRLTPIETKLLSLLLKFDGRTASTEYILRRIWPMENAYEDRLHAVVYRLRKKIEANPKKPIYIVSDWSKGYQLPRDFFVEDLVSNENKESVSTEKTETTS